MTGYENFGINIILQDMHVNVRNIIKTAEPGNQLNKPISAKYHLAAKWTSRDVYDALKFQQNIEIKS